MSEAAEAPSAVWDISAGTLLRRAREAAGLHVAAVSTAPEPPAPGASEAVPAPLAAAVVAPAVAPAPTDGIVLIRAKGESWIEVVDANGGVAVRKLMTPGETAGASGALPLTVT